MCIHSGFVCGVTFQQEDTIPDPFLTGRVAIPKVSPSSSLWSLRNVICEGAEFDLRLHKAGVGSMEAASSSNPWQSAKMKLMAVAHFKIAQPNTKLLASHVKMQRRRRSIDNASGPPRPSMKHIAKTPYLYNCDIDGLRVLVDLESRDTLLILADAYLSVVLASIPSFQRPPSGLMGSPAPLKVSDATTAKASFQPPTDLDESFAWNKLFAITTRSMQISIMDESKKGIILLAGNVIRVTNHITSSAHRERVHLDISEMCLYVAPTSVDVGMVYPWLWNFDDGKPVLYNSASSLQPDSSKLVNRLLAGRDRPPIEAYCTGMFKAVTAPFPATCTIVVSHQMNEHLAAWVLVPVLPAPPSPDDITTVRVVASVPNLTVHVESQELVIIHDIVLHTLAAQLPPMTILPTKINDAEEEKVCVCMCARMCVPVFHHCMALTDLLRHQRILLCTEFLLRSSNYDGWHHNYNGLLAARSCCCLPPAHVRWT